MNDITPEMILQSLNGALRNRNLYPPGHPAIAAMTKKSFNMLNEYLKGKDSALFGIMNETLVFDEFPIIDTGNAYIELIRRFTEQSIEAIVFEKGFTANELTDMVDVLFHDKPLDPAELNKLLEAKGIIRIKLKLLPKGKRNVLEIYNDAIEAVKNVMGEIRMGKIPSSVAVKNIVEEMTDSVFSDPNAMIGLTMIKNYDDYLYTHCVNVGVLAISIGKSLDYKDDDLHRVGVGALLHDIGKTAVDVDIITKPAALNDKEWEQIKTHPDLGKNIAERMEGLDDSIIRIIHEHHVKFDHTGYPPIETKLHPLTQIATIADAYDALTTLRVYQRPRQPLEAVALMRKFSGKTFDPEILNGFVKTIGLYPVGTVIRLPSNEVGVITNAATEKDRTAIIKFIFDGEGNPTSPPEERQVVLNEDMNIEILSPEDPPSDLINTSELFETVAREHDPEKPEVEKGSEDNAGKRKGRKEDFIKE